MKSKNLFKIIVMISHIFVILFFAGYAKMRKFISLFKASDKAQLSRKLTEFPMIKSFNHGKAYILSMILLLAGTLSMVGCNSRNKALSIKELSEILPEYITSYEMDGEIHTQKVKKLDVVKRNTDRDSDFIECSILLQDENMLRTIYADLYLTNYETGGWLIDYWRPYDEEIVQPVLPPDPKEIQQLVENEFSDFTRTGTDDSRLKEGIFTTAFAIHEEHAIASFSGNIICISEFSGYGASRNEMAYYNWKNKLQRDVKTVWNIEGEYLMTESDDDIPEKIYVSIDSYDPESKRAYVTAYEAWPAYRDDYLGYYGSYTNIGYTYVSENGINVSDAVLEINPKHGVWITFRADTFISHISDLENHDYSIVRVETKEIYDEWNDFPKGSKYEFPVSR